MKKTKEVVNAMAEFSDRMNQLYLDAEGLRDCTEDPTEKQVFNDTRNALYELRFQAKNLARKWAQGVTSLVAIAMISFSCASLQGTPDVNMAEFVITTIGPYDTLCVKERGILTRKFKNLDTQVEVSFVSSSFNINIRQAFRSESTYTFSGTAEDGTCYDVTMGRPQRGDAIIGFQKCEHEWIIIGLKCYAI